MTKSKMALFTLLIGVIIVTAIGAYRYYHASRWITVQKSPDDWVDVEDELAKKDSAPCPDMLLKQGSAKFLPSKAGKSEMLLGYKLTLDSQMGKTEKDAAKYAPYLYQIRFRFTLADKDGFPMQVVEGPKDFEMFELSKPRSYQNVCTTPIENNTADRTDRIYVTYILSATGSPTR